MTDRPRGRSSARAAGPGALGCAGAAGADTAGVEQPPTTAYGAVLESPRRTGAVLRAVAARSALELRHVDDCDLVAAVVAADLWCRVTHRTDLGQAATTGGPAQEAAARILARAAGYGDAGEGLCLDGGASGDVALAHLAGYQAWAAGAVGEELARVALWRAGSDLAGTDDRLTAVGLVLQLAAMDES